jgi:hypothetical protein
MGHERSMGHERALETGDEAPTGSRRAFNPLNAR